MCEFVLTTNIHTQKCATTLEESFMLKILQAFLHLKHNLTFFSWLFPHISFMVWSVLNIFCLKWIALLNVVWIYRLVSQIGMLAWRSYIINPIKLHVHTVVMWTCQTCFLNLKSSLHLMDWKMIFLNTSTSTWTIIIMI